MLADDLSVYHITRLLLFRPFLLLCLELKRRGIKDILRERNGGIEMTVLYEAAERSVKAAIDIIDFCDSMFSLQIGTEVFPAALCASSKRLQVQGPYNHGFYLESACFILALAAVHHSDRLTSNCFDKLHTGLRLLRQLSSHDPVRSTIAAVEQMIARICALPTSPGSNDRQAGSSDIPSTVADTSANHASHSAGLAVSPSALDPALDTLTPHTWGNDLLLDDIWSMMDWEVGFLSMDPNSSTPAPGLSDPIPKPWTLL